MACPMTIDNCKRYGITERQTKSFCDRGCLVKCDKEFEAKFKKQLSREDNGNDKESADRGGVLDCY